MISIVSFARQSLLLLLCGGAISVLVSVIINNPKQLHVREPAAFDFPQDVTLPDLAMLASKPLAARAFKNGVVATGRSYRYQRHQQPIEIEMRYIKNVLAVVSLDSMIQEFTKSPDTVIQPSTMKEQPGLGFYRLFVDKETAYLSTCINPEGVTTVTRNQSNNAVNRKLISVNIISNRLLPWLLGKQTLRDNRCLLTVLSTPIDPAAPNDSVKTLETVGANWIRWWQVHFPAA